MVATGLGAPPTEHKLLPQFRAGAGNGRPWLWTCDEEFGGVARCPVGLGGGQAVVMSLSVSLLGQGLTQDQLFSKRESKSSLLFVGRSGGPR